MKTQSVFLVFLLVAGVFWQAARAQEGSEQPDSWMQEQNASFQAITYEGKSTKAQKEKIGPGMEVIQIGEVNIIAPKGTRVKKEGSQVVFEDLGEYLGRRFDEVERRFARIEVQQEELKKELEEIKKTLAEMRKQSVLLE